MQQNFGETFKKLIDTAWSVERRPCVSICMRGQVGSSATLERPATFESGPATRGATLQLASQPGLQLEILPKRARLTRSFPK